MLSYDAMLGTERGRFALSLQKVRKTEFGAPRRSSLKDRLDRRSQERNRPEIGHIPFASNQMDILLAQLQRETLQMAAVGKDPLEVGRQTYQAMVANQIDQADVQRAAQEGTFSNKLTRFLESLGFKPDFKLRLSMRWAYVAFLLMLLVVACSGPVEATAPVSSTVMQSETAPVTEQVGETATPEGFGEETTVDYGRYAGEEQQADMIIIPKWQEIVDELNRLNLALPTNLEIIDVSTDNILVEALQTGRTDDYPEGTTFTISQVDSHEGELLTVTVNGANEVLSGSPAVGLAISIDGLPAALDAQGNVVAYVDPQTGQWTAGSRGLAPEVVANVPQTTATVEQPTYAQPTLDNVEFVGDIIERFLINQFPLAQTLLDGPPSYSLNCINDEIITGRAEIMSPEGKGTGIDLIAGSECWYKEPNQDYGVLTPLVLTDSKQMVIAGYIPKDYDPVYEELGTEEAWNGHLGNVGFTGRGHIFSVTVTVPRNDLGTNQGLGNEELGKVYTQELIEQFAAGNGDPSILPYVILNGIKYYVLPPFEIGMVNTLNR